MASRLPTIPRLIFTVFEPLSLYIHKIPCPLPLYTCFVRHSPLLTSFQSSIAGWTGATLNPAWFIHEQTSTTPLSVDDNAKLVALQLGNTYGLVFLIATAVLYTTSEIKVVRNYLVACWLADISHVYVCYHVLGWARFVDVASWNSMTWGNVGVTVSSCLYDRTT